MRLRGRKFELDKAQGKFLGVCAGLENYSGIDATIIRIGLVLATVMVFPWPILAYFVAAWLGRPKQDHGRYDRISTARYQSEERMRDLDRRMAEIESYMTSPNARLANEIEQLR